uniref:Uncharacterized protein n=1 Tax=Rhizophora mucronata TaxID=61149 RepID=A0A2P2PSN4_RHIMU
MQICQYELFKLKLEFNPQNCDCLTDEICSIILLDRTLFTYFVKTF